MNNYFNRVHHDIIQLQIVLLIIQHTSHTKIEVLFHVKVIVMLHNEEY